MLNFAKTVRRNINMHKSSLRQINSIVLGLLLTSSLSLSQLKLTDNQADYLIVTPSEFVPILEDFADWREKKNLNVEIVLLSEIYSEFPDSTKPNSIRSFVSYSLTYWSDPKPKYLLLVGSTRLLPSYKVISQFYNVPGLNEDSVSVDEWYSINQHESDTKPDISLGRFPVDNEHELLNVINKTMYFEDSLIIQNYQSDILFLTDKTDSLYYQNKVNALIDNYFPEEINSTKIFSGQDSAISITREKFFKGINDGTIFLTYYGEGLSNFWSKYNLFSVDDIDSLNNNKSFFVYTSASCKQSYDFPSDSSIITKLLISESKGTVASVASSGMIYNTQTDFLSSFFKQLFENPENPIGFSFLNAKLYPDYNIYNEHPSGYQRKFTLLGDPALKLPLNVIVNIEKEKEAFPTYYLLSQNYPNPFNPTTTIVYNIPFSNHVTLEIFNILGQRIRKLVDDFQYEGNYKITFDASELPTGVYIYRLKSGSYAESKKMLILK